MTKTDLMDLLFHHHGLRRDEASTIVERIFRAMADALRQGDEVKITNFGVFEVRTRAARPGRNPRTGAFVPIPARQVVVFRAAEGLLHPQQKDEPCERGHGVLID
jgi:integration host factor subunit alpha